MILLGIDWGTQHIGLALSDHEGRVAFPYGVFPAEPREIFLNTLKEIIKKEEVGTVVVGMPLGSAREIEVKTFIEKLSAILSVPIYSFDERRSTKALPFLRKQKPSKQVRNKVVRDVARNRDAVSATLILQGYLDKNSIKLSFSRASG